MKPTIFVIFGATGDLTHRKLFPALYHLANKDNLPDKFCMVAVARRDKSHEEYRGDVRTSIQKYVDNADKSIVDKIMEKLFYFRTDFEKDRKFGALKSYLEGLDREFDTQHNRTYYLATKPEHFGVIVKEMTEHGFVDNTHIDRIIIEKPFGTDLASAQQLNVTLRKLFEEEEIYRIDHYLGKESVQNLFALRFANHIFESIWNKDHIDNIQITVAEDLGVGTRGGYYDQAGAIRDMVQNHLLQILCLMAMEAPSSFDADAVTDQKVEVVKNISTRNFVTGQYQGYTEEDRVSDDSHTETYAALEVVVDTPRWEGMPFYLRTGKRLPKKSSEVAVYFKKAPLFDVKPNVLVIELQPDAAIRMRFNVKQPGTTFSIGRESMDFCHDCLFNINTPEAYEKLLHDAFSDDKTLFTRWDEVEASWQFIDPIEKEKKEPRIYGQGTWGPDAADNLLAQNGHHWRLRKGK